MSHYLLEKSRICGQMAEERNYHAFYRLIAGAPADLRATLGLDPKASYAVRCVVLLVGILAVTCVQSHCHFCHMLVVTLSLSSHATLPSCFSSCIIGSCSAVLQYLNQKSRNDPSLDDVTGFRMMVASMDSVGMTTGEKMDLMQLTAAILHLGNITFEEYNKENKGQRLYCITACVRLRERFPDASRRTHHTSESSRKPWKRQCPCDL